MDQEVYVEKFISQLELLNLNLDELRDARKELKPAPWSNELIKAMDRMIESRSRTLTNNAIRERLNSSNLSLEDLITARAYGISAGCDPDIIDDLNEAIDAFKENQTN